MMMHPPVGHSEFSWLANLCPGAGAREGDEQEYVEVPCGHTRYSWGLADFDVRKKARGLNKLASMFQKRGMMDKAIGMYRSALRVDCGCLFAHYNLGVAINAVFGKRAWKLVEREFYLATLIDPKFEEALVDLAAIRLKEGRDVYDAVELCREALKLNRFSPQASWNLATGLRQCGKRDEAIETSWQLIEERASYGGMHIDRINIGSSTICNGSNNPSGVCVVCVKWGTKYDAEYVNKLYRGVFRNLEKVKFEFFCFTDDPEGLDPNIHLRSLPTPDWEGWWHKASVLFSGKLNDAIGTCVYTRILYVDLDTVITGSLDEIASYDGTFAILGKLFHSVLLPRFINIGIFLQQEPMISHAQKDVWVDITHPFCCSTGQTNCFIKYSQCLTSTVWTS